MAGTGFSADILVAPSAGGIPVPEDVRLSELLSTWPPGRSFLQCRILEVRQKSGSNST